MIEMDRENVRPEYLVVYRAEESLLFTLQFFLVAHSEWPLKFDFNHLAGFVCLAWW